MVVTADAGRVVYSGALNCPSQQTCNAAYVAPTLHEPYTYRFLDSTGKLITAHLDSNSDLNVEDIKTSDVMLGLHLFALLTSSTALSPIELSHKLDRLFTYYDSPDATPDFFEELGMYYNQQASSSVTEAQFLVDIAALLSNDEILPAPPAVAKAKLLSQPRAMASIDDVGGCQPVSAFFSIATAATNDLKKLLPGAGLMFSMAGDMFNAACGSSMGDLAASLADITAKLNVMDTKLTLLGYKMDGLRSQIAEVSLQDGLIEADKPYQQLGGYITKYRSVLRADSARPAGYANLDDYIQSQGGLTQELYNNSSVIKSLFDGLNDQNAMHAQLLNTDNLEKIRAALDVSCQDASRISKDVIATRNGCNLVILNLMTKVSTTQASGIRIMRDMINVVNKATQDAVASKDSARETWLKNNFAPPFATWETADATAVSMLSNNMTSLANKFSQSLISPIEGLSTELTSSMTNARCTRTVDGQTGPALLEWYTQPDAFIRTQCTSAGKPVNARYYYAKDGTNAVNIMGVLVKANWWSDYPRTPLSYTNIPAKSEGTSLYFNNVIPSGVMSVNNWPASSTKSTTYIEPANNYSYGDATGPYVMYAGTYLTRLKITAGQNSGTSLLSYRHTDGYTYVWLQRNEAIANEPSISLYMECITGDCKNHTDPKFLKFTNSANKAFKVGWSTVERGSEKLYTEAM